MSADLCVDASVVCEELNMTCQLICVMMHQLSEELDICHLIFDDASVVCEALDMTCHLICLMMHQ